MTKRDRLDRLPRVSDRHELAKGSTWEETDALLKKQMEVLLDNWIELLTPEARRRLVPRPSYPLNDAG